MIFVRATLLFIFIELSLVSFSQQVQNDVYTSFINLTPSDGLSNSMINDIYQDKYGFIWIGTEDGLNRYDGYKFIVFRTIDHDSTSLSNNVITSIAGDSSGNIWVGTTGGLNFYNRKTGEFVRFMSNLDSFNSIRSNHVRKVLLQNDSMLWIETLDGTLSELDLKTGNFSHYCHKPVTQPYYRYHEIWPDTNGEIWVGGRNMPIFIFNPELKTFRTIEADYTNSRKKRDDDLATVLKTSKGTYYVGGIDGFYRYNPQSDEFTKLYARSTFSLQELDNGNILIGAGDGLMIYDPVKNSRMVFTNNPDNPRSLVNNSITKVLIDKDGNIWIGTEEGISILNRQELAFKTYFHIPGNDNSLSGNRVSSILQDRKGRIWIGTEDQGLNLWDTVTNTFRQFKHNTANSQSLASDNITKIYEDRNGTLWIGLWSGIGFNRFDPKTNRFIRYAIDYKGRKKDWYNDILEDSNQNFWMGVWGGLGIQQFDRQNGKFLNNHFWSLHIPLDRPIQKLVSDGVGNIFEQTDQAVIYQFNTQQNKFNGHMWDKMLQVDSSLYRYFACDLPINPGKILAMASNKKGLTLFATDAGLISYDAIHRKFSSNPFISKDAEHFFYQKEGDFFWLISTDSLIQLNHSLQVVSKQAINMDWNNFLNSRLVLDQNGNCWINSKHGLFRWSLPDNHMVQIPWNSTYSYEKIQVAPLKDELLIASPEGLIRMNWHTIDIRPVNFPRNEAFMQNITNMSVISENRVILVSGYGLAFLNPETNQVKPMNIQSALPDINFLISSVVECDGKLFLSVNTNVFMLDTLDGTLTQITHPDNHMVSSRLTTNLMEDATGHIWIGTSDNGLNRLNLQTGFINHYSSDNQLSSIPDNDITGLYLDPAHVVWIGTNKGLCCFDEHTGQFIRHGLLWKTQRVRSMVSSSDSILWIGTTNGLIRYNTDNYSYQVYNEADGLPSEMFNRGARQLQNGLIAMATEHGFITFNPNQLQKNNSFSPVEFTGFSLFDQPVDLNIHSGDTLKLRYNNNFFTIGFSSLSFRYPAMVPYVYQLTGMGDSWITTTEPEANFTNLPPGKYLFNVTLQGFQEIQGALSHLVIVITPPFWKTTWFWLIILVLIFGVIFIILLGYIRQLKMNERNGLLEQKLLSAQMNPHFIFNTLSAIQSFMYHNEPETAGNYLANFSSLVRLILENSRAELISLRKEVQTLKLYLGLQQLRFTDKFDFEITIDPHINQKITFIPPMLAQPFIENSIEHGIMHLKEKGTIFITFKLDGDVLIIEVVDDGIGLKQSKLLNKNRESHTSFATSITRERLAHLKKRDKKEVGIMVEERSDTEATQGTRVILRIPYRTDYKAEKQ